MKRVMIDTNIFISAVLFPKGHGLNAGPGIDFDSPEAWNEWYFNRPQHGGHPEAQQPGQKDII